jgi:hypothetical protein
VEWDERAGRPGSFGYLLLPPESGGAGVDEKNGAFEIALVKIFDHHLLIV